jgi:hypothetical protein
MASIVPARTVSSRRATPVEYPEQIANFDFLSRIGCGGVCDKMASPQGQANRWSRRACPVAKRGDSELNGRHANSSLGIQEVEKFRSTTERARFSLLVRVERDEERRVLQ